MIESDGGQKPTGEGPQSELEELLRETPAAARESEQTAFDRLAAPLGDRLVLFGAGQLGGKTLAGLRRMGIEPLAFVDNNSAFWGKSIDGLLVLSPMAAAERFGQSAAFVVTIWSPGAKRRFSHIKEQLTGLGCSRVVSFIPLFWKYPDIFLPHYRIDLPHKIHARATEIRGAFALFTDTESQSEFVTQLRWLQSWDGFDHAQTSSSEVTYLPDSIFAVGPDEVFVDCGAFDGDTIRTFIQHACGTRPFERVVAFEPDPANFTKLGMYLAMLPGDLRRRIAPHKLGVGARQEKLKFQATGTVSSAISAKGTMEIDVVTLDEILNGDVPTYVKMDIEGAEPGALAGGQRMIRQHRPVLAVCVYHRQDHLWWLPLLMHSFDERYRLFLRRYGDEYADVVCYAVPPERLLRGSARA
jgi:FkbM family methyltransferase